MLNRSRTLSEHLFFKSLKLIFKVSVAAKRRIIKTFWHYRQMRFKLRPASAVLACLKITQKYTIKISTEYSETNPVKSKVFDKNQKNISESTRNIKQILR